MSATTTPSTACAVGGQKATATAWCCFAAILLLVIGCFNLVAGPANPDKWRR